MAAIMILRFCVRLLIGIVLMLFLGSARSFALIVCPPGQTQRGLDVSQFQGAVNWDSVATSGIVFAFARVGDGTFIDTRFDSNYAAIKAAGLIRGAYQFFEPAVDPLTQANLL